MFKVVFGILMHYFNLKLILQEMLMIPFLFHNLKNLRLKYKIILMMLKICIKKVVLEVLDIIVIGNNHKLEKIF